MDLSTTYMGLKLRNPIIASASPLSEDVDTVKRLEDAGAAGVVMYSLFEEQINHEINEMDEVLLGTSDSSAEALSYFPPIDQFKNLHAEDYLEQIRRLKEAVDIPIIASLNGVSPGGWMQYARKMQDAGADALELNIYYMATDPEMTAEKVEDMYLEDLKTVKDTVSIPVGIKLSPFFSALANFAIRLDNAGADGLVLFNRFYQPDINLEELEVESTIQLSTEVELRLPLRWIAVLYGKVKASLAATSGIHTGLDVVKMIMVGADVTMIASALLKNGPEYVGTMLKQMQEYMEKHEYNSVSEMRGILSHQKMKNPAAFERANYIKVLQSFH